MILPIATLGIPLNRAHLAQRDFHSTVAQLLAQLAASDGEPTTASQELSNVALSQLRSARSSELMLWTVLRWLLGGANILFVGELAILVYFGWAVLSGLWNHVAVYRKGMLHLRQLQELQTTCALSRIHVRRQASRCLADTVTFAYQDDRLERSRIVWLDEHEDVMDPHSMFSNGGGMGHAGTVISGDHELRSQVREMAARYRYTIFYTVRKPRWNVPK